MPDDADHLWGAAQPPPSPITPIEMVFGMKRSAIRRERFLQFSSISLALALAVLSLPAFAMGTGGTDTVRSLYDALLSTMRNSAMLGPRGRYAQLEPVVRRVFDIPFMTRLAVGPQWEGVSQTQRDEVSRAFVRYVAAIYAERFDGYSGERLQVTGERPSAGGTIITSQIVKSNGQPVSINYLMRNNGGVWQIADVYLDGTISEMATRRSEFAAILRAQGITGLIQTLNAKADTLTAARAS
jgi:phospholipid transport system substrate-binding protein